MYTIREFAKKRINSGVFARFVLFLSGIERKINIVALFKRSEEYPAEKARGAYASCFIGGIFR